MRSSRSRPTALVLSLVLMLVGLAACGGKQAPPPEPEPDRDAAAEVDSAARADSLQRARDRAAAAADLCDRAEAALEQEDYEQARNLFERVQSEYPESECAGRAESELPRITKLEVITARIHFPFDQSRITDEAAQVLRRKAEVLRDDPGVRLVIEGHCDERGSNEYNMALGQRRANAARQYLLDLGVPERVIVRTVSYGEERPLVNRSTAEAWAENRRAEFEIRDMGEI